MSRDSTATFIHMHSSRFADIFEDFTSSHMLAPNNHAAAVAASHQQPRKPPSAMLTSAATHSVHLPHEDIFVPPQHQPPNPEDEDDVVPDQHAAFGITKAMQLREGRERVWRDFESLRGLVRGDSLGVGAAGDRSGLRTGRIMPR